MLYNEYPTLTYNLKEVSNILIRFDFLNLFTEQQFIDNYYINDHDTPETLSLTHYGNSKHSWVILLLNGYFNRELDWPMSSGRLQLHLDKKYDYSSIFFLEGIDTSPGTDMPLEPNITFSFSKIKYLRYGLNDYTIKSYDRTFNRLDISQKLPTSLGTTDNIHLLDENKRVLVEGETIDRILYESGHAIHHFEDSDKNTLNVRDFIAAYINSDPNPVLEEKVVTNIQYEEAINDDKRRIILLKPEYFPIFMSRIKNILESVEDRKSIENV